MGFPFVLFVSAFESFVVSSFLTTKSTKVITKVHKGIPENAINGEVSLKQPKGNNFMLKI